MKKTLFLIDGSSYLFRAYHALPPLTNAGGEPTGAIYGVINMLLKDLQQYGSEGFCMVFDAKGKNFRHELYPEYKANRGEMPEELVPQVQPIHDIVRALGVPLLCVPGVEADDVIGTLAVEGAAAGYNVVVSSGDKDMAQLVNDQVLLVNTMSGTELDVAGVVEKFGVKPEQIIDYLTLIGDKVDNVPGVPKVGPKTAAKWLNEYQTLDNLLANADAIKGKVGEYLREAAPDLPLSKELVTIKQDVELESAIDELHLHEADKDSLRELYARFEFNAWLKRLDDVASAAADTAMHAQAESRYHAVQDKKAFAALLKKLDAAKSFVFDLETTSLHVVEAEIVGVALAINGDAEAGEAFYIPVGHTYEDVPEQLDRDWVLAQLTPYFADQTKTKLAHNLKYDLGVLANYDIEVRGKCLDTMLESYVVDSAASRHDLDSLALKYLGVNTIKFSDVAGKGAKQVTFDKVSIEDATPYAAEDALVCSKLHQHFYPRLEQDIKLMALYQDVEVPLLKVLSKMERWGVLLDEDTLAIQAKDLRARLDDLQTQIYTLAGEEFNIDSPKQLQHILFTKLELPVLAKTPKGQASTAESVLTDLAVNYELPAVILEYRSLNKLLTTYVEKLPRDVSTVTGRIHGSFHQAVTATGRLSSSDPNLQNIPIRRPEGRNIRKAFVVPEGHKMMTFDYSQVELRIMAHLSEDATLLDAFAHDADIHSITASEIFQVPVAEVTGDHRRQAKAVNFGLIYGMSGFGLAKQLGISREEAERYIACYFERYPGVKQYMERTRASAHEHGFVETLLGRRLYLPDINAKQVPKRMAAERTAINAPLQGTAADLIKRAMLGVMDWLAQEKMQTKMIIQVHDELVFEVPEAEVTKVQQTVPEIMGASLQLKVPLKVSVGIGDNWEEAH